MKAKLKIRKTTTKEKIIGLIGWVIFIALLIWIFN